MVIQCLQFQVSLYMCRLRLASNRWKKNYSKGWFDWYNIKVLNYEIIAIPECSQILTYQLYSFKQLSIIPKPDTYFATFTVFVMLHTFNPNKL